MCFIFLKKETQKIKGSSSEKKVIYVMMLLMSKSLFKNSQLLPKIKIKYNYILEKRNNNAAIRPPSIKNIFNCLRLIAS